MKRLGAVASLFLAIYIPFVLFAGLSDRLILFPSTHRVDAGDAVRKMVPFQQGNLEIWTARSESAKQRGQADVFVLRFYGNADRADRWPSLEAEMWNERAVEVWGVNYPGFGGSTGPAELNRIAPAAITAFDALKETARENPIVVFGTSIGSTAALHVAAHRPVTGVILHNPVPLKQVIVRQFGWWNLWLLAGPVAAQVPAELDAIANAKRARAPAIFLLADRDEIIAPRFQRLVVGAYESEKRVIELAGATHNSPIDDAAMVDLYQALDWLLPRR
ncbi:MAG TPA: alpha/beta fold hydrolase [Chthoniobacterales bacterium]|nr:alpha/beta fold hydrolase [Chthoniobacterales bacterium]